jgi:hypothetical protein
MEKALTVYFFMYYFKKLCLMYIVELIGGSSLSNGNVYATNPPTGIYGPVCDDNWDIDDVSPII